MRKISAAICVSAFSAARCVPAHADRIYGDYLETAARCVHRLLLCQQPGQPGRQQATMAWRVKEDRGTARADGLAVVPSPGEATWGPIYGPVSREAVLIVDQKASAAQQRRSLSSQGKWGEAAGKHSGGGNSPHLNSIERRRALLGFAAGRQPCQVQDARALSYGSRLRQRNVYYTPLSDAENYMPAGERT